MASLRAAGNQSRWRESGGMHTYVGYAWAFSAAASSGCMDTLRKVRFRVSGSGIHQGSA
ncbi:hypothetical protein OAD67_00150 [bacterium]|nr:hypothetical protein [bacterium]MDB9924648.1 hypothetical protein [bacterium]